MRSLFLFCLILLAGPLSLALNEGSSKIDCLEGFYDLGARAAAMAFRCDSDEGGAPIGILTFCHRKTLLNKNNCTGEGMPIRCRWQDEAASWSCDESGDYPFHAIVRRTSPTSLHYQFQSSFNEGEFEGALIPARP